MGRFVDNPPLYCTYCGRELDIHREREGDKFLIYVKCPKVNALRRFFFRDYHTFQLTDCIEDSSKILFDPFTGGKRG